MEKTLRSCADQIVEASIRAVLPDEAVRRALKDFHPEGRTVLVAAGKAAWQMAHAAVAVLGHVDGGVVVTKYDHVKGKIPGVTCCEAGHPVPDAGKAIAGQNAGGGEQGHLGVVGYPALAVPVRRDALRAVEIADGMVRHELHRVSQSVSGRAAQQRALDAIQCIHRSSSCAL